MKNFLLFLIIPWLCACSKDLGVSFQTSSQSVLESSGTTKVVVSLTRNNQVGPIDSFTTNSSNNREIRVPYKVSGTAIYGVHHLLQDGVIVFPPGTKNLDIQVKILHHRVFEENKTLIITLLDSEGADLGSQTEHTIEIEDVDRSPRVDFVGSSQQVTESVGVVGIGINLEYPATAPATIPLNFAGSAIKGTHFTAPDQIDIPLGGTSAVLEITVIDDFDINPDRNILISFGELVGASLGSNTVYDLLIVDNDDLPTAFFPSATESISEAVGSSSVTINLSKTYPFSVTIPLTISGTAQSPADHNLVSQNVIIPAGQLSGTVPFSVVDDNLNEANETIIVTMGTPTNANAGNPSVLTITVLDNDPLPSVRFQAASQTVSEAVGSVTVTVQLNTASGRQVVVPYTASGTATNPSDHNLSSGSVVINAGATSTTVSFSVVNDTVFENNETVILTLGSPTNASLGSPSVHTVTIQDNDPPPVVQVTTASASVTEGNTGSSSHTINISLTGSTAVSASIPFSFSGTATQGSDYNITTSSPLVIPAGQSTASVQLTVSGDTMHELDETVIFSLGTPTGATLGAVTTSTLTILNDDPVPTLNFEAATKDVSESAGTVFAIVTLTNTSYQTVSAPFTVSGTATFPADHNLQASSFSISSGGTFGLISFSIVDDAISEGTETIILTLGSPSNAVLGATSALTFNVLDNDRLFDLSHVHLWLDANWGVRLGPQKRLKHWIPRKGDPDFSKQLSDSMRWVLPEPPKKGTVAHLKLNDWRSILNSDVSREKDTVFWVGSQHGNLRDLLYDEVPYEKIRKDFISDYDRSITELISADCEVDEENCDRIRNHISLKYFNK